MKILRGYGFHSMKPSVLFEMEIEKYWNCIIHPQGVWDSELSKLGYNCFLHLILIPSISQPL